MGGLSWTVAAASLCSLLAPMPRPTLHCREVYEACRRVGFDGSSSPPFRPSTLPP